LILRHGAITPHRSAAPAGDGQPPACHAAYTQHQRTAAQRA